MPFLYIFCFEIIQYNYIMISNKCVFTLTLFVRTCYNMNQKTVVPHQASGCTSTLNFGDKNNYSESNFTETD